MRDRYGHNFLSFVINGNAVAGFADMNEKTIYISMKFAQKFHVVGGNLLHAPRRMQRLQSNILFAVFACIDVKLSNYIAAK